MKQKPIFIQIYYLPKQKQEKKQPDRRKSLSGLTLPPRKLRVHRQLEHSKSIKENAANHIDLRVGWFLILQVAAKTELIFGFDGRHYPRVHISS